jgi:hypothetical protein
MSGDNTIAGYPAAVAGLVSGVFVLGMEHFEGHEYQTGLAQIFCHAIRDAILDELEGATPDLKGIPARVAERLHPSTPESARDAFRKLDFAGFAESYNHIRLLAANEGIDLEQLADALRDSAAVFKAAAAAVKARTGP